jgi:hypothetical protein
MKSFPVTAAAAVLFSGFALAQSPAATIGITLGDKALEIKYNSPRVNGREGKLFGPGGRISSDPNYPVWRAGANAPPNSTPAPR